jgi:3-isopropylmalate dehydrogenase
MGVPEAGIVKHQITVLPGDGIGPEVIAKALEKFEGRFDVTMIDAGAERYLATGELLTSGELTAIAGSDALLFGAIGDPRVPDGVLERGILLRLRKELDLYVNLRPFPELGLVFVRENTEGLYAGFGWRSEGSAAEVNVNTSGAIARCVRYAFELATTRSGRLTWVHKTNVLTHSGDLWREVVMRVASEYPDIEVRYEHVDAAAYHLVTDHSRFDVVVTDNLFGDILSDVAAGVAGGLGGAASANLHPVAATRPTRCVGLFEPVHGSAPDIAGTGTADPTAALRATEMLIAALSTERSVSA